jgi:uncharacterized protein
MTSVVLDTNALVSGFARVNPDAAPSQLIDLWRAHAFDLIVSEHIKVEVERTFARPYFRRKMTDVQIARAKALLDSDARLVRPDVPVHGVATHPEDDVVLSTAVSARADYLVTGDAQLQKLGAYEGVTIVSPRRFVDLLLAGRAGRQMMQAVSGWCSRHQAWYQPFLFLLLLPLFTVPATMFLRIAVVDCWVPRGFCDMICAVECPTIPVIGSLAPGLLGLACVCWARSTRPEVKEAGSVATVLAILRVVVPAVDIFVAGWGAGWTTGLAVTATNSLSTFLSPALWMGTLLAFVFFWSWAPRQWPTEPIAIRDDASGLVAVSDDTSDESFRSFAEQALRSDRDAQFGPILSEWRRTRSKRVPLRDSLLQVFVEEQRRARGG